MMSFFIIAILDSICYVYTDITVHTGNKSDKQKYPIHKSHNMAIIIIIAAMYVRKELAKVISMLY